MSFLKGQNIRGLVGKNDWPRYVPVFLAADFLAGPMTSVTSVIPINPFFNIHRRYHNYAG